MDETDAKNALDFDSIRQINSFQKEFWSARDLMPLLGYDKWQKFEGAIKRAIISCQQTGQNVPDHFIGGGKMVQLGSGAKREVKDYFLSRFACYLIAQNGDPRKIEIASAQSYFAISTRQNELRQIEDEQNERLALRKRVAENNLALMEAAKRAGVLSKSFGVFQNAGYEGMYGGLGLDKIKELKGIKVNEDILDRMGRMELAANDFRITQTEGKLSEGTVIGKQAAIETHRDIGKKVRGVIEDIGGTMPEDLPAEPSLKPLLQQSKGKKLRSAKVQPEDAPSSPDNDTTR